MPGVAWNAGMFAWQRGAIRAALEKYTPLPMLIDQAVGSDLALAERLRPDHPDLDRPGGHGERRRRPPRRDGRDGRRLERPRELDGAPRRDRRRPTPAARPGRVVQTGESIDARPDDLVVRPVGGRLDRRAGPAVGGGRAATIVADGVWAHLAGARHLADEVRGLLDRVDHEEVRA